MMPIINRRKAIPLLSMAPFAMAAVTRNGTGGPPVADFAPGQEWSIKSSSPTTAKIIVGRVEPWRDGVCVNVSVVDVPIPRGMPGAGGVTEIGHLPFEKRALLASVDQLLATDVSLPPVFEDGYKQWHDAKGGIYTISVEQAIRIMFEMINQRRG